MAPFQFTFTMPGPSNRSPFTHNTRDDADHGPQPATRPVKSSPPTAGFLKVLFHVLPQRRPGMAHVPVEIQEQIISLVQENVGQGPPNSRTCPRKFVRHRHPAMTPPRSGAAPLMTLPTELRRYIFAGSLPGHGTTYHPLCDDEEAGRVKKSNSQSAARKVGRRKHSTPNLLTINRRISEEITEILYSERTFVVHVHEGLQTGGVEFLDEGRQPLQYQDSVDYDKRFERFRNLEKFGFQRLKKIIIQIHPPTEESNRHIAVNTHLMCLTLCRLLERSTNERNRITIIKIEFATPGASTTNCTTRAAILRHEKPWMDTNGPKQSSFHDLSDIELVLRPFAMLTRCHSAIVQLPAYLTNDVHLSAFVAHLQQSMMSWHGTLLPNAILERQVEQIRPKMESNVVQALYSNGNRTHVAKLTEGDLLEEASDDDSDGDEQEFLVIPRRSRRQQVPQRTLRWKDERSTAWSQHIEPVDCDDEDETERWRLELAEQYASGDLTLEVLEEMSVADEQESYLAKLPQAKRNAAWQIRRSSRGAVMGRSASNQPTAGSQNVLQPRSDNLAVDVNHKTSTAPATAEDTARTVPTTAAATDATIDDPIEIDVAVQAASALIGMSSSLLTPTPSNVDGSFKAEHSDVASAQSTRAMMTVDLTGVTTKSTHSDIGTAVARCGARTPRAVVRAGDNGTDILSSENGSQQEQGGKEADKRMPVRFIVD